MWKLQKIWLVEYLVKRECLNSSHYLAIFQDFSRDPFEKTRKYFRFEEDAMKFLKVSKKYFKIACPEYKHLIDDSTFRMKSKIRLIRE